MKLRSLLFLAATTLLGACDQISQQLGLEDAQRKELKADAEGKAVGSACRQSGRAIEDCYSLYRWLPKASIFAGWREMNDYMQANNLGVVEPKLPPAGPDDKKKTAKASNPASEERKAGESETKATANKSEQKAETSDEPAASGKKGEKASATP
jgi:hypothetical protein